jgi:hypothetical protein
MFQRVLLLPEEAAAGRVGLGQTVDRSRLPHHAGGEALGGPIGGQGEAAPFSREHAQDRVDEGGLAPAGPPMMTSTFEPAASRSASRWRSARPGRGRPSPAARAQSRAAGEVKGLVLDSSHIDWGAFDRFVPVLPLHESLKGVLRRAHSRCWRTASRLPAHSRSAAALGIVGPHQAIRRLASPRRTVRSRGQLGPAIGAILRRLRWHRMTGSVRAGGRPAG